MEGLVQQRQTAVASGHRDPVRLSEASLLVILMVRFPRFLIAVVLACRILSGVLSLVRSHR